MLDDIRGSFTKDGLQWAMQPERKMVHLWKKLLRAEEELRKTAMEVNTAEIVLWATIDMQHLYYQWGIFPVFFPGSTV